MVTSKKLKQMAKRWMKAAGIGMKRISFLNVTDGASTGAACRTTPIAKGHFTVYTNDKKRFAVPLKWLASDIFGELLKMAEDEFGLPGDGPITLTVDAYTMEEIMKLMKDGSKVSKEAYSVSLASLQCSRYSSHLPSRDDTQQVLVC